MFWQSWWLMPLGILAGVASGLFGIGGGVVLVPSLVLLAGFAVERAAGISLAAMLLPVGIFGVWEYHRSGRLDRPSLFLAVWVALGMFVGIWLGARLAEHLSAAILRRSFAVLMVVVALRLWFSVDSGI